MAKRRHPLRNARAARRPAVDLKQEIAALKCELAQALERQNATARDLQESLEYQTATSDVLQVISRSTFDLQPVLDPVLATAARLCNADIAGLARRDGEVYRMAASYALPPDYDAIVRSQAYRPGRGTVTGRTALEGRVVHIADIGVDPDYAMPETISIGKVRTALGVPLLRGAQPIGVVWLARQRAEPFTERQIELVRTFADQAVIAIENARLLSELSESLQQQTATADVLKIISRSTVELKTVLDALRETAARLCRADQTYMLRRQTDGLHYLIASHGVSEEGRVYIETHPFAPDRGTPSGRVALERRPIHIPDVLADPEFTYTEAQRIAGFRTVLGLPLLRQDTLIGVFSICRSRVEPFTDKEIELLTTFARPSGDCD